MGPSHELASAAAVADRSCATDTDCVFFDASPDCAIRCGGEVVSQSGAGTLGGVVSHIEQTVCTPACAETYPPCPPQPTPDGRMKIVRDGATSTSTLSAADFALIDGTLRSMDFRQWEASHSPRDCGGDTKAEPQLELDLRTAGGEVGMGVGMNVTGCTLAGPGMTDVLATLASVITAY